MALREVFLTVGLILTGCGGDDVSCGSGTTLVAGMCVGSAGPTCGMGTTLVDGMCVGSAGPTCGAGTSLVNGMCVGDSCGPGTVLQNGACVVDTSSPSPVTALAATSTSSSVGLTWTAGASSTGTLVARLVAGAYDAPAPLTTYTAGQTLPGGATVIAVGSGTTATDTITTPGRYSYLAWSINASGKYGFPREVSSVVTVPAQTGTVVIDVAAATATVTAQPANVALAAANVVFDGTSAVTFDLSATQNTAGHLFNVKAVFGAPSTGAVANATSTTDAGDPFLTLGVGAIPPAVTVTKSVAIGNVAATDTVTLPITIKESGLAIVGANAIDMDGGPAYSMQLPMVRGRGNSDPIFTAGQLDASGRYFVGATRWSPDVFRLDTATGDVTAIEPFPVASGSISCLTVASDGFAYAVIGMGPHRRGSADGFALAKIDPITMTPVAAASVVPASAAVVRGCAIHGSKLALAYGGDVYLADLATMTFTDTDASTPDVIDPVAVSGTALHQLVFSPDGTTLYASERRRSQIDAVDVTALTAAPYHTATGNVLGIAIDAAGTLWWGQSSGLFSFDGTTETQVPNFTEQVDAIGPWTGTKVAVAQNTGASAFVLDVTDGTITRRGALNSDRLGHEYAAFPTP